MHTLSVNPFIHMDIEGSVNMKCQSWHSNYHLHCLINANTILQYNFQILYYFRYSLNNSPFQPHSLLFLQLHTKNHSKVFLRQVAPGTLAHCMQNPKWLLGADLEIILSFLALIGIFLRVLTHPFNLTTLKFRVKKNSWTNWGFNCS